VRPMTGRPRDPSMTLSSMVLDMDTLETWRAGQYLYLTKSVLHCAILSWPLSSADRANPFLVCCFVVVCYPGQPPNEKLLIIDTVSPNGRTTIKTASRVIGYSISPREAKRTTTRSPSLSLASGRPLTRVTLIWIILDFRVASLDTTEPRPRSSPTPTSREMRG